MCAMETISQTLNRLFNKGYDLSFRTRKDGSFLLMPSGIKVAPEALVVDYIYRFEGETDLNDAAIIFAISWPEKNAKGTYLVAFGPMMDPVDTEMVQLLQKS